MKTRSYLTSEDKEYIIENCSEKFVSEMAVELNVPPTRIHMFIKAKHLDFKRAEHSKKHENVFKKGFFNPHERDNWLV